MSQQEVHKVRVLSLSSPRLQGQKACLLQMFSTGSLARCPRVCQFVIARLSYTVRTDCTECLQNNL